MTDADKLRALLAAGGYSQRAVARELDITDRTIRRYCAGDPVPRAVMLAVEHLIVCARFTPPSA